jgi:hypothetical protein
MICDTSTGKHGPIQIDCSQFTSEDERRITIVMDTVYIVTLMSLLKER